MTPPHVLTIAADGTPSLACPYDPPTLGMECASVVPCNDCDDLRDTALCPESPTCEHHWQDDELVHPWPLCWTTDRAGELEDAINGLGLHPGTWHVWPMEGAEEHGVHRLTLTLTPPNVRAS